MSEANPSGKMFRGAKNLGKRVPKAAWYIVGGGVIVGGVLYYRNRDDSGYGEAPLDETGAVGYTDASSGVPGVIVAPGPPGEAVSAEINTDIPVATLGIFGDIISGLIERIPDATDLQVLAGAGSPVAGADAGGVVTAAPITPAPAGGTAPKPNPCAKLESGYHCGNKVDMGPNARKTFPSAVGWARVGSGGSGASHYIDVHVRYCKKLERWRVHPNKGNQWAKTWSGERPGIC